MAEEYAVLPRSVRQVGGLSNGAKLCYVALVDYAYNDVFAFPSQETLAVELQRTTRMVKHYLKELREFGLIKVYSPEVIRRTDGRLSASSTNRYILVPIKDVANMRDGKMVKVPLDAQFLSQEEFNEIVEKNEVFFAGVDGSAGREKYDAVVEKIKVARESEDYSRLTARDYCVAFAEIYKEQYGESYPICWKTDSSTIKIMFLDKGIEGEGAFTVMRQFVKMYATNFYAEKYKRPRISHLKVDWIMSKVLTAVLDMANSLDDAGAEERMEVVDEWRM